MHINGQLIELTSTGPILSLCNRSDNKISPVEFSLNVSWTLNVFSVQLDAYHPYTNIAHCVVSIVVSIEVCAIK